MRILIIDTYYGEFLKGIRKKYPALRDKSYKEQLNCLLGQFFGTSDFYSYNLKKIGHQAQDLIVNDEFLQRKWAEENSFETSSGNILSFFQMLPFFHKFLGRPSWVQGITLAQIKAYKPDVVYMQDLSVLMPGTLKKVKKYSKLLVGQIASPLPPKEYIENYDLITTSFPHYVKKLKRMGIKSEYFKIGFEPRVLKAIKDRKRVYDVSFVGSFTPQHRQGTKILEKVASEVPIHIWGRGTEFLSPNSPLKRHYHGQAWGLDMYKILAKSKIVLNRHINVSEDYANNMRLYEATGVGAMLITDVKKNLDEFFKVGTEIVDYKNEQDLVEKIKYYLSNNNERSKIAQMGQQRTLRDHTYLKRMYELEDILEKYLK